MEQLFECWTMLAGEVGAFFWALRWPIAVYAGLYAIGAAAFLLSLRFKSRDGRLIVSRDSWAYMIAHPMRYGGHRKHKGGQGSICTFYARMFNMLLIIWPLLLIYFALVLTVGSVFYFLLAGHVLCPDLREAGFVRYCRVTFPLIVVTAPLGLIVWGIIKHAALFRALRIAGWAVLCISPALVLVALLAAALYKSRDPKSETASAFREVVVAQKHRFCKFIQFE